MHLLDHRAPPVGTVDPLRVAARHNVRLRRPDPASPLQVGNGEFAFSVDATGLQTFPDDYATSVCSLLGTQANWGFHSTPFEGGDVPQLSACTVDYPTSKGSTPYVDLPGAHDGPDQSPAATWLRNNPHRLHLGLVQLAGDQPLTSLTDTDQTLDLTTGLIDSSFRLDGAAHRVVTAVHPDTDAVAFRVEREGAPARLRLRFPYGSEAWAGGADWEAPDRHRTQLLASPHGFVIDRWLDDTHYLVALSGAGLSARIVGAHSIEIELGDSGEIVVEFLPPGRPPLDTDVGAVVAASAGHWRDFWLSGAAVDFSASSDERAVELERRVVLSHYLTAVNCAGSLPPQETGLLVNSWRGKFHLEMHYWHAAHFALWARPQLLARSLRWYETIADRATATATAQGCDGARWPKQVGPDGRESPSSIGPFLVWQQPHPIHLAVLLHRADPSRETLDRWADLVEMTASFMASFVTDTAHGHALGPPVVPAQECYADGRGTARNPVFELAYWSWALDEAAEWMARVGRPAPESWRRVAASMAPPAIDDGRYVALETPPRLLRTDHPSMLGAFGVVPPTELVDPALMSATLDDVLADWDWESVWGWDYPMLAMTATRLGRPEDAVDALLADHPKNQFGVNGHNWQTEQLPAYLPNNGGLLTAVALMVGGWDGSADSPGFGDGWTVAHRGLFRSPGGVVR